MIQSSFFFGISFTIIGTGFKPNISNGRKALYKMITGEMLVFHCFMQGEFEP
jgi:hypothetical protein